MKTITAIIALICVIKDLVNNLILWNVMIFYVIKQSLFYIRRLKTRKNDSPICNKTAKKVIP